MQALRPYSLTQATSLAKLQEDKIKERRRFFKTRPPTTASSSQNSTSNTTTTNLPPLLPTLKPNKLNYRKLSPEEMSSRREKGLCYNYDEVFNPQRKCKGHFFLLITEEPPDSIPNLFDEQPTSNAFDDTTPTDDPSNKALLSLHALSGCTTASTIHLNGRISNYPVIILIDGGSTDNFVQQRITKFLELLSVPTSTLKVMVGNGETLDYNRFCPNIPIYLQTEKKLVDFYVLPLCGADVVLGAPWLQCIGPVLMDYSNLSLSFTHKNKHITLNAEKRPSYHQIRPNKGNV